MLKWKVAIVLDLREVAGALRIARIGEVAARALAAVLLAVAEVDGVDRDLDGFAAVSETSPFAPASFSAGASSGVSVPAIFSISSRFLIITFLIPNALAISRNSARLFPSSAFRSCIVYFR